MSEYRLRNHIFSRTVSVWPWVTPTNHSSCEKTRMNDLSCGVRMIAQVSFILSQSMHLTDRPTVGQLSPGYTVH